MTPPGPIGAALLFGLAGLVLMIFFEGPLTRALGVACLFAFVVLGVRAVASPSYLVGPDEEDG